MIHRAHAMCTWLVLSTFLLGGRALGQDDPGPMALTGEVWGSDAFALKDNVIAAFFDPQGRPCALDGQGVSCFDDDGEEAWGLSADDLFDVLVSDGRVWLSGDGRVLSVRPDRRGRTSVEEIAGDHPVAMGDDEVVYILDAGELRPSDGSDTIDVGSVDVADVLRGSNGDVGLIDHEGGLVWLDADGEVSQRTRTGVSEPLRALRTDAGWAVLGVDEVGLLDTNGEVLAVVDADWDDAAIADGELWLSSDLGVEAVDVRTGIFDEELVHDDVFLGFSATADGSVLAGVPVGRTSLQVWHGDERSGGAQHPGSIIRVVPRPGGGVATVDDGGKALLWSANGVPVELDTLGVLDLAFGGDGSMWIATDEGLLRENRGKSVEVNAQGNWVVSLAAGALSGDGTSLSRVDAAGETLWTVDAPHELRPRVVSDTIVTLGVGISLVDLESGQRRRRLDEADRIEMDAGVAVGGLVAVGHGGDESGRAGWRPGGPVVTVDPESRGGLMVLSPDGRSFAQIRHGLVQIRSTANSALLAEGTRATALDTDIKEAAWVGQTLWLGRSDGKVERWPVGEAVVDAALPPFNGYAQLETYVPIPDGPSATFSARVGAGATGISVHPDGRVGVVGAVTAVVRAEGATEVVVFDPPATTTAGLWDPQLGWVVSTSRGQVWARSGAGERTLVAKLGTPVDRICADSVGLVAFSKASMWRLGESLTPPELTSAGLGPKTCGPQGIATAPPHPGGARVAQSLDSGMVVSGGMDETVVMWQDGRPLYVLEGHCAPVEHLQVDASGQRLVAGGAAGAVVWDLATLQPLARLGPDMAVIDVGFDGSGGQVWVLGADGDLRRFDLPPPPVAPDDPMMPERETGP
ncbi:MAG: hypothetical protein AB8H79_04540 [Myxococcota bacterium]